jgi:hypothetical protein
LPRNKLCGSINFIFFDLWIKSYGETKNLGQVWVGWASAKELTRSTQCGLKEEKGVWRGEKKALAQGKAVVVGRRPAKWALTAGQLTIAGQLVTHFSNL